MAWLTAAGIADALRRNRPVVVGQVGALARQGAALGQTAVKVARVVGQYFSPWFTPRRDGGGRLVRVGRLGDVRSWPGRAGMASSHARLVMLTETQRAHAAGVERRARERGALVRYRLADSHPRADPCDVLAHADNGHGPGVYEPGSVPAFPHIRCMCRIETYDPGTGRRLADD